MGGRERKGEKEVWEDGEDPAPTLQLVSHGGGKSKGAH